MCSRAGEVQDAGGAAAGVGPGCLAPADKVAAIIIMNAPSPSCIGL